MKKRNKEEVLSGQRIKIAALLTGISLLLLSGCGNKAQEAEESQVQTDLSRMRRQRCGCYQRNQLQTLWRQWWKYLPAVRWKRW